VTWNGRTPVAVPVAGSGRGRVTLPPAPAGRRRLAVAVTAPAAGTVVLDRVEVLP